MGCGLCHDTSTKEEDYSLAKPLQQQPSFAQPKQQQQSSFKPEQQQKSSAQLKQPEMFHIKLNKSPDPNLTPQQSQIILPFLNNFLSIKVINAKLNTIAYTSKDLKDLFGRTVSYLTDMSQLQTQQEKLKMKKMFEGIKKQIKKGNMYFGDVKKKWQEQLSKQGKLMKHCHESRIFNTIANIKKQKYNPFQQDSLQQQKPPKKSGYKNRKHAQKKLESQQQMQHRHYRKMQVTQRYNKLQQIDIDKLANLQHIVHHTQQLASYFNFKYSSMKQEHHSITSILTNCFHYSFRLQMDKLKYNLNVKECLLVAQISRKACEYDAQGIVFMLHYFMRSFTNLQKSQNNPKVIQDKLNLAVKAISKQYPPGQGLKGDEKQLRKMMEGVQIDKEHFEALTIKLDSQQNKTKDRKQAIRDGILGFARIAEKHKASFQELIKQTCLQRCITYKSNLKLSPKEPKEQAIIRIQEKMFFQDDKKKKKAIEPQSSKNKGNNLDEKKNLEQNMEEEDRKYQKMMDEKLSALSVVKFEVTDMVRGKCTFLQLTDILSTIQDIKSFVKRQKQSTDTTNKYRIISVENRFTRKVPISDITLKIVLNQEIVAELQLTLQTNAAAYNFAHKIYEFSRSEIFSKIKVVHNYTKEFMGEFIEMVERRLSIAHHQKQKELTDVTDFIKRYFGIADNSSDPSQQSHKIEQTICKDKINAISEINKLQQNHKFLNNTIFRLKVQQSEQLTIKQLRQYIQGMHKTGKSSSTLHFRAVAALQHWKHLYSTTKSQQIQYSDYKKRSDQINANSYDNLKSFKVSQQMLLNSDDIHQYVEEPHWIEGERSNRYIQLLKEAIYFRKINKQYDKAQQLLIKALQILNVMNNYGPALDENNSEQLNNNGSALDENNSDQWRKYGSSFDENNRQQLKYYGQALDENNSEQLNNNGSALDENRGEQLNNYEQVLDENHSEQYLQLKLMLAQNYLQRNTPQKMKDLLKQLQKQYQIRQLSTKVIICRLLQLETQLKQQNKKGVYFREEYLKIEGHAKVMGVILSGEMILESLWRISDHLLQQVPVNNRRTKALRANIQFKLNIINQFGAYKRVEDMITIYQQTQQQLKIGLGQKYQLNIQSMENKTKTTFRPRKISQLNMALKLSWPKLHQMTINEQDISQILQLFNWPSLSWLELTYNKIGDIGCEHLSKVNLPNIEKLDLTSNKIGSIGCKYLSKANWPNINGLCLSYNTIGDSGCEHLSKANWPNMEFLVLNRNSIGDIGCQNLSKANWPNIKGLILSESQIGDIGCEHLSKANWPNIEELSLSVNKIGDIGCEHLSKANWPKIKRLNLYANKISQESKQNLKKQFNLTYLGNSI